jgi:hypothetical protein
MKVILIVWYLSTGKEMDGKQDDLNAKILAFSPLQHQRQGHQKHVDVLNKDDI